MSIYAPPERMESEEGVPLVLREISDGRREPVMSLMWVGWKAV